jgi:DNA invertase Pin-like site-specific DNA recombinase
MATQQSIQEIRRVVLYARVSTFHNQNPEMQLAELREYAVRRGWAVIGEYVDIGISGSRESRPELNRMLTAAHSRACDAVLVWKLDRLGRSLKHLVNTLADLDARGVAFVSLHDNLDLSTPSGRLMLHIIGAMAEFERELIRERVIAGIQSARKRGVSVRTAESFREHRENPRDAGAQCSLARDCGSTRHRNRNRGARAPKRRCCMSAATEQHYVPVPKAQPAAKGPRLLRFPGKGAAQC